MATSHTWIFSSSEDMHGLADESVGLVVTSPPYPMIGMWDEPFSAQDDRIGCALLQGDGDSAFSAMHRLLDRVWSECFRLLVPGGFLCINIGDAVRTIGSSFRLYSNHTRILQACTGLGFHVLPLILWRKQTNAPTKFMGSGMLPAGAYVTLEHEYILILRKGEKRSFSSPEEKAARRESAIFWEERNVWFSDLWDFKGIRQAASGNRERSAAFPLELAVRLVRMYSVAGDTVLDPFMGTGTTALACIETGRSFTGYEIDGAFRSELPGSIREFSRTVNGRIRDRIARHLAFIERYRVEKKEPLYRNRVHGFPVITRQETGLVIPTVEDVQFTGTGVSVCYTADGGTGR